MKQIDTDHRVLEQPLKIPFIAAVISSVNINRPKAVDEVLARAGTVLKEQLQAGDWREVKLVLKLLACLQDILEGNGVFPILNELFNRAADLQTASSEDVSKVEIWLSSGLIYAPTELRSRAREDHPSHDPISYVFRGDRA